MSKNRLETFSDGVIAIIITIMVQVVAAVNGADFARWPTILYGLNLLCCALAYLILQQRIIRRHGPGSLLAEAVAGDFKGKISAVLYVAGIFSAWRIRAWIGTVFFVITALMWLVPDRRMERALAGHTDRVR